MIGEEIETGVSVGGAQVRKGQALNGVSFSHVRDFLCLYLQIMDLKEIAEYMDIAATNPQGFVHHRWLSVYDIGMQTKGMLPVYRILYLGFMGQEDKALYKDPL